MQRLHSPETQHRPLPSSERQVAILDPVVQPAAHLAAIQVAEFAHGSRVGTQAISDDRLHPPMPLQSLLQEPQCRRFVPFLGDVGFQDFTLMVDGSPEIMGLSVDFHVHLIQVPAPLAEAPHPAHPLPPDVRCEKRA